MLNDIKNHFENAIEHSRTAIEIAMAMKASLKIKPSIHTCVYVLFVIFANGCFEGVPDPELSRQVHILTQEVGHLQGELQASQEFNHILAGAMFVVGIVMVIAIVALAIELNARKKEQVKIQEVHEFERLIEPRYVVIIDRATNEVKKVPMHELSGPIKEKLLEYRG